MARMPPRTRKKTTEEAPVTEETAPETVEPAPEETPEEVEAPKRGRKRSELGHAARDFEKFSRVAAILEKRYADQAERLSVTAADLATARTVRDEAKAKLDAALNGAS